MKKEFNRLSERYAEVLRRHLKVGVSARFSGAFRLGREAVNLGLETFDLARLHERALKLLGISDKNRGPFRQAKAFFTEATIPIVETYHGARESKLKIKRLNRRLVRRTLELAASNRQLQRGVIRRKGMEAALKKSGAHYAKLADFLAFILLCGQYLVG